MDDSILASNPTIQTNLTLYFLNRHNYQRYHYTNLFACVQAIVRLSKDKEWMDKSAEIQEMFNNPMKKYFEKYQRLLPLKISLSRLEFIAWRDQHFNLRLNKIYYIDDRLDLEFGQILDVLEFFKNELHICLSDFLEAYNIPQEMHIPESMLGYMVQPTSVGFRNA